MNLRGRQPSPASSPAPEEGRWITRSGAGRIGRPFRLAGYRLGYLISGGVVVTALLIALIIPGPRRVSGGASDTVPAGHRSEPQDP